MIFQNVVKTVTTSALFLLSGWSLAGGVDVNSNAFSQDATNLIIKYKAATSETRSFFDFNASLDKLESKHKVSMTPSRLLFNQSQLVKVGNGTDVNSLLSQLNADPSVEYAEADIRLYAMYETDDTRYDELWGIHGQPAGVNAPGAWDVTAGYGVRVAVIDTGYRPHLDLADNIVGGYDFISDQGNAVDGDGRDADASDPGDGTEGWWFIPDDKSSWHGTHVAGTIAALGNNSEGIVGVAHQSQVVPIRVLGRDGGSLADIADAIVWASGGSVSGVPENQYPAQVINMSLGAEAKHKLLT